MATSDAPTAAEVARIVAASVRDRLPPGWQATEALEPARGSRRPDLEINLEAPDGRTARLVIEIRQLLERRDIGRIVEQSRSMARSPTDVPVVSARYLSASVREALAEQGLSFVDATGNIRIVEPVARTVDVGVCRSLASAGGVGRICGWGSTLWPRIMTSSC